jgi:uncharacterized protein YkwD
MGFCSKEVKTFFKVLIAVYLASFPLMMFFAGYRMGEKRIVVVAQADAPVAQITQEKKIGEVAGTESAEREGIVLENRAETIRSEVEEPNVSTNEALWQAINSYREKHGLPGFTKDETLCEFTDKRLEQLKARGSLDSHEGFKAETDHYLKDKGFRKIAENIASGYKSAIDVIDKGWDTSAGHQALLQSAELDRACVSAGGEFGVLIAAKKQ